MTNRDDGVTVLAINMNECRDLMHACMMSRMASLGWTEREAKQACNKAIDKVIAKVPARLERVAEICGRAVQDSAPQEVLTMLARAEFAVGGIEIADEMNKSRLASMN